MRTNWPTRSRRGRRGVISAATAAVLSHGFRRSVAGTLLTTKSLLREAFTLLPSNAAPTGHRVLWHLLTALERELRTVREGWFDETNRRRLVRPTAVKDVEHLDDI